MLVRADGDLQHIFLEYSQEIQGIRYNIGFLKQHHYINNSSQKHTGHKRSNNVPPVKLGGCNSTNFLLTTIFFHTNWGS